MRLTHPQASIFIPFSAIPSVLFGIKQVQILLLSQVGEKDVKRKKKKSLLSKERRLE